MSKLVYDDVLFAIPKPKEYTKKRSCRECGKDLKRTRYYKCEECVKDLDSDDWDQNIVYFSSEE